MKREEIADMYWFETVGYGEIKSYRSLKNVVLKIDLVDCVARFEDGRIAGSDSSLPYCFISGRNLADDETITTAIINKADFVNAWKIDKEYGGYDCYLQYKPALILSRLFPQFEFSVYERGGSPIGPHSMPRLVRLKGESREVR